MNMRILLVRALAFAGVVGVAQADTAQVQPVPYHYGMSLKVAKVLSMTEPATPECQVITANMTFIDKAGKLKAISYRKLSDACSYQN